MAIFNSRIQFLDVILLLYCGVVSLLCVSCEKEDPVPEPPSFSLPSLQQGTYVLSYDTFRSPDDVVVASRDSMYIEANIDYLVSQGADLSRGDVIVVWRAIDELPFIRRIIDKKNTGTVLRLTTEDADFGSVFQDADIIFSTTLKIFSDNPFLPPYVRYTHDNICHPAVIITHFSNGSSKAVTSDQLIMEDPDWNILTFDSDSDLDTTFVFNGVEFDFNRNFVVSNMGVEVQLSVQNTLLRRFECTSSGESSIFTTNTYKCDEAADASISSRFTTPTSYTLIYWAGPIPVAISVNQEVRLDIDFHSQAPLQFTTNVAFNTEYNIGSSYRSGWRPVKDVSLRFQSDVDSVKVSDQVGAETSITTLNASKVGIYNDFYSDITVGYSIISSWEKTSINGDEVAKSSAEFWFGGSVSGNNYITAWEIPQWREPFNVVSATAWDTWFPLNSNSAD